MTTHGFQAVPKNQQIVESPYAVISDVALLKIQRRELNVHPVEMLEAVEVSHANVIEDAEQHLSWFSVANSKKLARYARKIAQQYDDDGDIIPVHQMLAAVKLFDEQAKAHGFDLCCSPYCAGQLIRRIQIFEAKGA